VRLTNFLLTGIITLGVAMGYAADTLPKPDSPFKGKIDSSGDQSSADWLRRSTAKKGAPNVILMLLADVGFCPASNFGGPVAESGLDGLAKGGQRYYRSHINSPCSPTRAALLSGRNDPEIGFGTVIDAARGYPGYDCSTAAFVKWHETPAWKFSRVISE